MADAVAREVMEETGLSVEPGPWVGCVERIGPDHHFVIHDYVATLAPGVSPHETGSAADDAAALRWQDADHAGGGRRPGPGAPELPRRARAGARQRPFHWGGRFSMNAVRPSLRSSERITVPMAGWSSTSACRRRRRRRPATTCRLSHTASGAASQMAAARASASVSARARLDQPVHQPELVGPLGRDGLAGEDGLHRGGPADGPGQAEEPAGPGDQVALDLGQARTPSGWWPRPGRRRARSRSRRRWPDRRRRRSPACAAPGRRSRRSRRVRCDSVAPWPALIAFRSAPAQNTGRSWPSVLARRTPTQTSGSSSMASMAASIAVGDVAVDGVAGLRAVQRDERDAPLYLVVDHGAAW